MENNATSSNSSIWRNVSERSFNKIVQPMTIKKGHPVENPLAWKDSKNQSNLIRKGTWGAKSFMVLDALGYMFLRRIGKGSIPKEPLPFFKNEDKMISAEEGYNYENQKRMSVSAFDNTPGKIYQITFTDRDFRNYTSLDLSSNENLRLLESTSMVEFKLHYYYRMLKDKTLKECLYKMRYFSRPYEFWYEDVQKRKDGIVQLRKYYINFHTFLGDMFMHNMSMKNYDWLDSSFYRLPLNAQNFHRQFVLHNNFQQIQVLYPTIKYRLNLHDNNITNQIMTIEKNILGPLIKHGYIDSYEKDKSADNVVIFKIKRPKKGGGWNSTLYQDQETAGMSVDAGCENH